MGQATLSRAGVRTQALDGLSVAARGLGAADLPFGERDSKH